MSKQFWSKTNNEIKTIQWQSWGCHPKVPSLKWVRPNNVFSAAGNFGHTDDVMWWVSTSGHCHVGLLEGKLRVAWTNRDWGLLFTWWVNKKGTWLVLLYYIDWHFIVIIYIYCIIYHIKHVYYTIVVYIYIYVSLLLVQAVPPTDVPFSSFLIPSASAAKRQVPASSDGVTSLRMGFIPTNEADDRWGPRKRAILVAATVEIWLWLN